MTAQEINNLKLNCRRIFAELTEAAEENNISLEDLDKSEVFDLWLKWNGIIGYTERILYFVKILDMPK